MSLVTVAVEQLEQAVSIRTFTASADAWYWRQEDREKALVVCDADVAFAQKGLFRAIAMAVV